jgi:radical SAM-linked protein
MLKIRMALKKTEAMKYVGHLDFGRAIERALRRAKLPVAYSVGFNPHMKLSFGPALGVGVASDAEYVDAEMISMVDETEFGQKLSHQLPSGLILVKAKQVNSTASLAAELNLAGYSVKIDSEPSPDNLVAAETALEMFSKAEAISYIRSSPKGVKTIDLKSFLMDDPSLVTGSGCINILFWLRLKSTGAVKPQELMKVLVEQYGFPAGNMGYLRFELKAETITGFKDAFEI